MSRQAFFPEEVTVYMSKNSGQEWEFFPALHKKISAVKILFGCLGRFSRVRSNRSPRGYLHQFILHASQTFCAVPCAPHVARREGRVEECNSGPAVISRLPASVHPLCRSRTRPRRRMSECSLSQVRRQRRASPDLLFSSDWRSC
jgi:hypothetical protein